MGDSRGGKVGGRCEAWEREGETAISRQVVVMANLFGVVHEGHGSRLEEEVRKEGRLGREAAAATAAAVLRGNQWGRCR